MPTTLLDQPIDLYHGITDEATRRQVLLGLGTIGLLTACGNREINETAPPVADVRSLIDDRGEVQLDGVPERIVTTLEESTELAVALGIKPVGVGSSRVDQTRGDRIFEGYYLTPEQIGTPTYVGPDPFNLEAISALDPDLIVHGYVDDVSLPALEKIAPTAVYVVTGPNGWQQALRRLAAGLGREQQATAAIDGYAGEVQRARETLAPIVAAAPRITVIYPNYRGGGDTLLFNREFALAAVFPELGFDLVGFEKAAPLGPGFGNISLELIADIDTDTFIAVGPTDWTATASAPILSTLDVPVLSVITRTDWPTVGPLTSRVRLGFIVEALQQRTGG